MLNDLGNGLGERYARGGQLADLKAAIEVVQEALEVTAADDPNRPAMLSNLASGLRELYDQSGAATDLDAASRLGRRRWRPRLPTISVDRRS